MNCVEIEPYQSISLPAGNLHAYPFGSGIEGMATSDNVLRAGFTSKEVALEAVLETVKYEVLTTPVWIPPILGNAVSYPTPGEEFALTCFQVGADPTPLLLDGRAALVLSTERAVLLQSRNSSIELAQGEAGFIMAAAHGVIARGPATLFVAHSR
jgi:mannose-6-phosphate isomerase